MNKISSTVYIVLALITFIFNIGVASADTGSITVEQLVENTYLKAKSTGTAPTDLTKIYWKTGTYNYISYFRLNDSSTIYTLRNESRSSRFTITSGGTGGGYAYYANGTPGNENITWAFDTTATMTSSPLTISYTDTGFVGSIVFAATYDLAQNPATLVGDTVPVLICACTGFTETVTGQYFSVTSTRTTDTYEITYPVVGGQQFFDLNMTKGDINTHHLVSDYAVSTILLNESSFNQNNYDLLALYPNGLIINVSLSTGAYTVAVINTTNANIPTSPNTPSVGANGVGIVFDFNTYTPNTFANISWIRDHSIPFGSTDTVVLSPPSGINVVLAINPASSGFVKYALSEIGNYKVMYNRTGLFGLGTPETLDSSTAIVTNENPSYIIANANVPSGIAFNASYLFGYTPAIQGELNSIKIERIDLQDITYYSTVSLNNTNIVANTEYNISLTISGLGTYKLSLFDISRGFIANTTVRTIEVPIPIQRNITTSYIMTDLDTYFKGDNIEISYGIDNTNFTSYPEKYIRIIHSSGNNPETGRLLTTMQEDIINVEITEVSTWFKWFSGVNYVELHAKNSTTDILLANTSFTLAFIDSDGYGLEISPSTLCTGGTVYIKTSSPSSTLLTVDVYQKNSNGNKLLYYQTFVNGSNKTRQLKLVFDGEYFFNLYDTSNASRFVKKVVVNKGNCEVVVTPTATPLTPEKAQNDVTNLLTNSIFWALILIVGMMIATGVEMRQRQADAMIPMIAVAFLGLAGFTLIGWVPAWITFSIILLLVVIFAWQRAKDANTGGG